MSRKAGESTLGTISLTDLTAAFADFPKAKVKVSKGWAKQVEAAFGVKLKFEEDAAPVALPTEAAEEVKAA
jgi:hypothetical protein